MNEFLSFRKMITPAVIQVIFWLMTLVAVIAGLVQIFSGDGVWQGLLMIVLGPLVVRIYCELLIVIFSINRTLIETRDLLRDGKISSEE